MAVPRPALVRMSKLAPIFFARFCDSHDGVDQTQQRLLPSILRTHRRDHLTTALRLHSAQSRFPNRFILCVISVPIF